MSKVSFPVRVSRINKALFFWAKRGHTMPVRHIPRMHRKPTEVRIAKTRSINGKRFKFMMTNIVNLSIETMFSPINMSEEDKLMTCNRLHRVLL